MRKGILMNELAVGVPFTMWPKGWTSVYMKVTKTSFIRIATSLGWEVGGLYTGLQNVWETKVYPVAGADIPFNTQSEPEPKFKAGDVVRVTDGSLSNALVGQLAIVIKAGKLADSNWGQYAGQFIYKVEGKVLQTIAESSLELVCSK